MRVPVLPGVAIVLAATASLQAETIVAGGLAITSHDPRFVAATERDGSVRWNCAASLCRGRGEPHIFLVAGAGKSEACRLDSFGSRDARREVVAAGGTSFRVVTVESGCRALSPPLQQACGTVAGVTMVFTVSPGGLGCNPGSPVPHQAFLDFLRGLRIEPH